MRVSTLSYNVWYSYSHWRSLCHKLQVGRWTLDWTLRVLIGWNGATQPSFCVVGPREAFLDVVCWCVMGRILREITRCMKRIPVLTYAPNFPSISSSMATKVISGSQNMVWNNIFQYILFLRRRYQACPFIRDTAKSHRFCVTDAWHRSIGRDIYCNVQP